MVNYNMTLVWSGNNLYEQFVAINTLANNYISMSIVALVFLVVYFATNTTSFSRRLMYASLGSLFVSSGLMFLDLLSNVLPIVLLMVVIFTIAYEMFS